MKTLGLLSAAAVGTVMLGLSGAASAAPIGTSLPALTTLAAAAEGSVEQVHSGATVTTGIVTGSGTGAIGTGAAGGNDDAQFRREPT